MTQLLNKTATEINDNTFSGMCLMHVDVGSTLFNQMKLITLTGKHGEGRFVQVDDEDYDFLNKHNWFCVKHRNTFYAHTTKGAIRMHRMLLGVVDPNIIVDHKDRNGLNNQRSNLRIATSVQNSQNRKKRKDYVYSKYIGVKLSKKGTLWTARISINKIRFLLGSFTNELDAAHAYNMAALEHFGEFANINTLPKDYIPSSKVLKKKYSIYQGVGPTRNGNKFRARINFQRTEISIGIFESELEAAVAYNKKAIELLGDKAKLNIIE